MNKEFWNALVEGLTPESPDDLQIWWKVPIVILFVGLIWAALV
tara:strand:- start:745 stop:873 length:129 start_codon:yes stop_codon:yes gene_type:complete